MVVYYNTETNIVQSRIVTGSALFLCRKRRYRNAEKIKVDHYSVYEKGRTYEVLKFPFIKHMWAYDDHPAEEMMLVDGCK